MYDKIHSIGLLFACNEVCKVNVLGLLLGVKKWTQLFPRGSQSSKSWCPQFEESWFLKAFEASVSRLTVLETMKLVAFMGSKRRSVFSFYEMQFRRVWWWNFERCVNYLPRHTKCILWKTTFFREIFPRQWQNFACKKFIILLHSFSFHFKVSYFTPKFLILLQRFSFYFEVYHFTSKLLFDFFVEGDHFSRN